MPPLRLAHGAQRFMPSLLDLRYHERMFMRGRHAIATIHTIKCFLEEYTKI
jgi:hypothetical protein